jgi:DNA-binding GntR family transcriptional regulator
VPRPSEFPYLTVAADLRDKINSGAMLPGEQVPSLDKISESYRVSRTTARRALAVLTDEGLIEVKPRWGAFVR